MSERPTHSNIDIHLKKPSVPEMARGPMDFMNRYICFEGLTRLAIETGLVEMWNFIGLSHLPLDSVPVAFGFFSYSAFWSIAKCETESTICEHRRNVFGDRRHCNSHVTAQSCHKTSKFMLSPLTNDHNRSLYSVSIHKCLNRTGKHRSYVQSVQTCLLLHVVVVLDLFNNIIKTSHNFPCAFEFHAIKRLYCAENQLAWKLVKLWANFMGWWVHVSTVPVYEIS